MKKLLCLLLLTSVFFLFACQQEASTTPHINGGYTMDGTISMASNDGTTGDEAVLSYAIIISGEEEDIMKIHAYEHLINPKYEDKIISDGPHVTEYLKDPTAFRIAGQFIFDTKDHSKEDFDDVYLLNGVEIFHENGGSFELTFYGFTE